ncbi:MAG: DNA repair protein RecO [Clostridia bacterium]|nr:DNA repair protein RecO [Clostridia bacterium]
MRHKVKGIVVREAAKGENDKLLTVLTGEEGVLTVSAPGVRKISATNLRSAQLFAYSDMLLYVKNGFYTLQESILHEDFYALREDVTEFALGCYLCELASAVSVGGEEGTEILRLLLNALYAAEKKLASPRVIKAAFEFRIAALIGYEPDLTECPICGKEADAIKNRMFELTDGYIFCGACENPEEGFTKRAKVSDACFAAMKHLLTVPVNKIFLFRLEETALAELSALTEDYLLLRVEKKLKTLDFLKKNL